MADSTTLQELEDIASDAMGDVHDMGTTIRDFARAASQAIWLELAGTLGDELKRIAAILGPNARASVIINSDPSSARFRVGVTMYVAAYQALETAFSETLPEALMLAELTATKYAHDHRVMCAADIGLAA